jgi:RNA polymerase sigma-70 factor (ECF subfamily)
MNSSSDERQDRLSRITTLWTMVRQAHARPGGPEPSAFERLFERYGGAVYQYLLGAVRRKDVADELFQEFALRLVRGDFHRADPGRGRFRDYLRKALVHLVTDFHRVRQAWPRPLAPDAPAPASAEDDQTFLSTWREELLERTWEALAVAQPTYHAVLLFRVQNPDVPSPDMADQLGRQLDRPLDADGVRKMLQRAHAKFADLLLEDVAASLFEPTPQDLEDELRALDLLKYCQPALERRAHKRRN